MAVVKTIEQSLFNRLDKLQSLCVQGRPLLDLIESLPVDPVPVVEDCFPTASAATLEQRGAVALSSPALLVGGPQCNYVGLPDGMPRFCGGFDGGCECSFFGSWGENHQRITELFDDFKNSARLQSDAGQDYFVNLGGDLWLFLPTGTAGNVRYRWQIQRNGITVLFHSSRSESIPAVRVVFGYDSFRNSDLFKNIDSVRVFLIGLGFTITREVLSRVDINVTLNLPFEYFQRAFENNEIVSRVSSWNKVSVHRRTGEKLVYLSGGSALQIVIYDKYHELCKRHNEIKLLDLSPVLGNSSDLSRVEFRFRREFLRDLGIDSSDQFADRLPDLIDYCCRRWFRILDREKVRGRENRQSISQEWRFVCSAFYSVFVRKDPRSLDRIKIRRPERSRLVAQAVGCLSSAFALIPDCDFDRDQFISELFDLALTFKRLIFRDYRRKLKKYRVLSGVCL